MLAPDLKSLRECRRREQKRTSLIVSSCATPHRLLSNAHNIKFTESPFSRESQRWRQGLWSSKRYKFSSKGVLHNSTCTATILKSSRYLGRHDEEIEQLKSERRPGRPSSNREDLLRQQVAIEDREHSAGFWLPDMEDGENLELLRNWNGEWTSLSNFKYVRLTRAGAKSPSRFPPKGQS